MTTTMSTVSPAGQSNPHRQPPPSWRDRRPSWDHPRGRALAIALAIALAVVAVLALAVPVGLSRLGGASPSAESAAVGGAPAVVQRDAGSSAGSAGSAGSLGSVAPGANDSGAAAPDAPTGSAAGSKPEAKLGSGTSGTSGTSATDAAAAAAAAPKIARTAWIGLEVGDLAGAAGRARMIASGAGGTVLSESVVPAVDPVGGATSASEPDGSLPSDGGVARYGPEGSWPSVGLHQARLTLSVPAEKLDSVLTQLSALGTVSYRSAQAQDVTATYVDTQARIDPARDSITRVRALMAKATDLQQLLVLESELTRRQADLDALTQQLAELDQRTTMSEVTATMWTPAAATAVEGSGVVRGLNAAWEGLLDSLTLVLTGLAVLLPWLLLLALGAFIVVRVMRRRRGTAAPTSP